MSWPVWPRSPPWPRPGRAGSRITSSELFPDAPYPVEEWRRHTLLWRAQFKTEGWRNIEPFITMADPNPRDPQTEGTTEFGIVSADPGIALSVTHAMVSMWLRSSEGAGPDELERAYRDCLNVISNSRPDEDVLSRDLHYSRVLRQLAADADRLPRSFRAEVLEIFRGSGLLDDPRAEVEVWAARAFGDLAEG
ncbi:hypothetical protein [Actinomadura sp. 6N118]|uniref:hypothetical protein n=1 Tax=Actinomadura sp. 6N118 TaxID=3375151 RepID=UPI0037A9E2D3